jgi:hypothetical protein
MVQRQLSVALAGLTLVLVVVACSADGAAGRDR